MYMHLIVGHDIIFGEERENPAGLLKNIPSKYIIGILGTWSNTLERKTNGPRTQWELLEASMVNFQAEIRNSIIKRLIVYENQKGRFSIFENRYIVEMIQREYMSFKQIDDKDFQGDPGTVELAILKAYCLIVDQTTEADNLGIDEALRIANEDEENRIYRMIWPFFAKQFEFAIGPDHIFEGYKGMAFLSFLSKRDPYKEHLAIFLEKFKKETPADYLGRMLAMIRDNLLHKDEGKPDDHFILFEQDSNDPWVQYLTVDASAIANDPKKQRDYIGMKEKPMFLFAANKYVIPYWKYMYSSLYPGLIFTFFRESGLSRKMKFPDFKQWLGLEFSERFLFRKLFNLCFGTRYAVRYYDGAFNPDSYVRRGRNVYIFEFKDNLINADVVQSLAFDQFKSAIDKAFIESDHSGDVSAKGISQLNRLITEMVSLCKKSNVNEELLPAGLQLSDLIIYPVIVYTNFYFDMPGVNHYLLKESAKRFPKDSDVTVKPVTTINLCYFYERALCFSDGQLQLNMELDAYHNNVEDRQRLALTTGSPDDQLGSVPSFAEWAEKYSTSYLEYRRSDFLNALLQQWEIM